MPYLHLNCRSPSPDSAPMACLIPAATYLIQHKMLHHVRNQLIQILVMPIIKLLSRQTSIQPNSRRRPPCPIDREMIPRPRRLPRRTKHGPGKFQRIPQYLNQSDPLPLIVPLDLPLRPVYTPPHLLDRPISRRLIQLSKKSMLCAAVRI